MNAVTDSPAVLWIATQSHGVGPAKARPDAHGRPIDRWGQRVGRRLSAASVAGRAGPVWTGGRPRPARRGRPRPRGTAGRIHAAGLPTAPPRRRAAGPTPAPGGRGPGTSRR